MPALFQNVPRLTGSGTARNKFKALMNTRHFRRVRFALLGSSYTTYNTAGKQYLMCMLREMKQRFPLAPGVVTLSETPLVGVTNISGATSAGSGGPFGMHQISASAVVGATVAPYAIPCNITTQGDQVVDYINTAASGLLLHISPDGYHCGNVVPGGHTPGANSWFDPTHNHDYEVFLMSHAASGTSVVGELRPKANGVTNPPDGTIQKTTTLTMPELASATVGIHKGVFSVVPADWNSRAYMAGLFRSGSATAVRIHSARFVNKTYPNGVAIGLFAGEGGYQFSNYSASHASIGAAIKASGCEVTIFRLGSNDLGSGGQSLATLEGHILSVIGQIKAFSPDHMFIFVTDHEPAVIVNEATFDQMAGLFQEISEEREDCIAVNIQNQLLQLRPVNAHDTASGTPTEWSASSVAYTTASPPVYLPQALASVTRSTALFQCIVNHTSSASNGPLQAASGVHNWRPCRVTTADATHLNSFGDDKSAGYTWDAIEELAS